MKKGLVILASVLSVLVMRNFMYLNEQKMDRINEHSEMSYSVVMEYDACENETESI